MSRHSSSTGSVQDTKKTRRSHDQAVAGLVAGSATVALLHPLDVIKTRLQVQDGTGPVPASKGMVAMGRMLWSSGGLRSLYAGLVPSMIGSGAAWGSYFYCYSISKKRRSHKKSPGVPLTDMDNLLSATEAGVAVSLMTNPIWVVKTRLQLQDKASIRVPNTRLYSGAIDCFKSIIREEGVRGLYSGLLPSLLLVSHGAIQLAAYEKLKKIAISLPKNSNHDDSERNRIYISEAGVCGALSKAAATLVTYPYQVMRSRLQQRMDIRDLKYSGFVSTVRLTLEREGMKGLYKGLAPNLVRVMPQSAVTFLVYEAVMHMIESLPHY